MKLNAVCTFRWLAFVALVVFLFSCASNAKTFHFDPDTTPEERQRGRAAMAIWNRHVLEAEHLSENENGMWRVTFTDDGMPDHDGFTCTDNRVAECGHAHWIRIRRTLTDRAPDDRDRRGVIVIAHEYGHALGLEHVPDPKSLMNEKGPPDDFTDLTNYDLTECQSAGACSVITVTRAP